VCEPSRASEPPSSAVSLLDYEDVCGDPPPKDEPPTLIIGNPAEHNVSSSPAAHPDHINRAVSEPDDDNSLIGEAQLRQWATEPDLDRSPSPPAPPTGSLSNQVGTSQFNTGIDDGGWAIEPDDDITGPIETSEPLVSFLAGPGADNLRRFKNLLRNNVAKNLIEQHLRLLLNRNLATLQTTHLYICYSAVYSDLMVCCKSLNDKNWLICMQL
jgi:hypothetical protein